jgi:hypothetical protein
LGAHVAALVPGVVAVMFRAFDPAADERRDTSASEINRHRRHNDFDRLLACQGAPSA